MAQGYSSCFKGVPLADMPTSGVSKSGDLFFCTTLLPTHLIWLTPPPPSENSFNNINPPSPCQVTFPLWKTSFHVSGLNECSSNQTVAYKVVTKTKVSVFLCLQRITNYHNYMQDARKRSLEPYIIIIIIIYMYSVSIRNQMIWIFGKCVV